MRNTLSAREYHMNLCIQANENSLPADFDNWGLTVGRTGWSVAHEAARAGTLPENFQDWTLRDNLDGFTVAHVAANYGHLPANFAECHPDILKLEDNGGHTVLDAIRDYNWRTTQG